MIYDKITNAPLYRGISPALDVALELIAAPDAAQWPLGRRDAAEGVFANVMDCPLKPLADTRWERHRKYMDIQVGFAPGEEIGVLPDDCVRGWEAHDEARDICFASDDAAGVRAPLKPGMFLLLFPTDAHRPCIATGTADVSRKLVVKVPV